MLTHNPAQIMAWIVTVLATILAVILLADKVPAQQQNQGQLLSPPTSVTAFPVQIRSGYEAIALIDHQNQTICLYQYTLNSPAHQRFSLLAARSFKYDSKLTDYNNAEPRPEDIKQWLQRSSQPIPTRGFTPVPNKSTTDNDSTNNKKDDINPANKKSP